ncbi:hypothetical protein [uncultured Tessaracoccus sp.]|uniref:hypothetical protein n=1 Tax=uncultured Tessaracoccus sp. TaxID=905023 RepID=UPI0025CF7AEA|nr:hypothetical protein [uncultured Tessaracoccus sp.]
MNEFLQAVLIVWIAMAIPTIAYGVVLAHRAGRSIGIAVILCLVLPWFGLLFFVSQPPGRRRVVGLGYYCATMLVVAAVMAVVSIFLPWVVGDPQVLGDSGHAPKDVLVLAVLVGLWALLLVGGSIGITRGADMAGGVILGICASVMGGVLLALVSLWGRAGLFDPDLRRAQEEVAQRVDVGPGGWIIVVALVVAYICATLLPFGLRLDPLEPAAPQDLPPEPFPGQPPAQGGPWPGQPWTQQPTPPTQPQWPSGTGAGW